MKYPQYSVKYIEPDQKWAVYKDNEMVKHSLEYKEAWLQLDRLRNGSLLEERK